MHDLEITWPDGQARFTPDDSPIRVGRSPEAAIILTEPSVSRRHLEFVWSGSSWAANDYSTHGSFDPIGVRLAINWTVGTDTVVRLGGSEGVEIQINLVTTRPPYDLAVQQPPATPTSPPALASLDNFSNGAGADVLQGAGTMASPVYPVSISEGQSLGQSTPSEFQPLAGTGLFDDPAPRPPLNTPLSPAGGLFGSGDLPNPNAEPLGYNPPIEQTRLSAYDTPADPHPPHGAGGLQPPPVPTRPGSMPAPPSTNGVLHHNGSQNAPTPQADQRASSISSLMPPSQRPIAPPPAEFDEPRLATEIDLREQAAHGLGGLPKNPVEPAAPPNLDPVGYRPVNVGAAPEQAVTSVPANDNLIASTASATAVNDSTLRVSIDGHDFMFMPGTEVTVGRDPSCLVTIDERHSLVSRRHLKILFRDNAWWIDDYSSKGTFIDGRRISDSYEAKGAFIVNLGDDEAGTSMRVITAGEHQAPRQNQNVLVYVAIGILALIALGALVLALQSRRGEELITLDGDTQVATRDLAKAKQATVLLFSDKGLGSGFFVSGDLILTNQHVAAIDQTLLVGVSRSTDDPAQVEYRAQTVALHPFLDIALLKLIGDSDGNPVSSTGIEPLQVAEEIDVVLGDGVYSTGFPNQLSLISSSDDSTLALPPVSVTSGEAANFARWPGCSNPSRDEFIPEGSPPGVLCSPTGDLPKAVVLTTFSSGRGASGGPVFEDDGTTVIAVVFAGAENEANAGRNIAAAAFAPWLKQAIADNS